ncbi:JAB domain-containing protein [Enterobacter roggenkampii]|uniref:JAB domain-containing protein n=1 Tax=Enterobacter roggenkampii TaxID=1812935 RepID=UPI00388FB92A
MPSAADKALTLRIKAALLLVEVNTHDHMIVSKRAARTVLTGMCYSVGSATRQGSSSLTRFIGQSAMTSRT